jgi:hypothetical protein
MFAHQAIERDGTRGADAEVVVIALLGRDGLQNRVYLRDDARREPPAGSEHKKDRAALPCETNSGLGKRHARPEVARRGGPDFDSSATAEPVDGDLEGFDDAEERQGFATIRNATAARSLEPVRPDALDQLALGRDRMCDEIVRAPVGAGATREVVYVEVRDGRRHDGALRVQHRMMDEGNGAGARHDSFRPRPTRFQMSGLTARVRSMDLSRRQRAMSP